jgi:hypothetical protein
MAKEFKTLKQKLKLFEKFENGEPVIKLAKDRWMGIQTICEINSNSTKLMEFVINCGSCCLY